MSWKDFDRLIEEGSADTFDWNAAIKGNASTPADALKVALMSGIIDNHDNDKLERFCTIVIELARQAGFYKRSDSDTADNMLRVLLQAEAWVNDSEPAHYPDWFYESQKLTQEIHPRFLPESAAATMPAQSDWLCVNSDRPDSWACFELFNVAQGRHYSLSIQTAEYMPADLRLDITSVATAHGEYGGGINMRDKAAEAFWVALSNHPTVDAETQQWMQQAISSYHATIERNKR